MNNFNKILVFLIMLITWSCSTTTPNTTYVKKEWSFAIHTGDEIEFPVKIINNSNLASLNASKETLLIFNDSVFSANKSAKENLDFLKTLEKNNINFVALNASDLAIIESQSLKIENQNMVFLNSSIYSSKNDQIIKNKKIVPYVIYKNVVLMSLAKDSEDSWNEDSSFYVSDYVLSLLQAKSEIDKLNAKNKKNKSKQPLYRSFLIIHSLDKQIDEVIERLPKNFISY